MDGLTFEDAKYKLMELIGMEAERFSFLRNSKKLSENDRNKYCALIQMFEGQYSMSGGNLTSSLQTLSQLLEKYYGQKTIILIDSIMYRWIRRFSMAIIKKWLRLCEDCLDRR